MSIRPVDMKTALYIADDASKLRENQKSHEAGIAEQQATQNKHNQETKIETVQHTENAEGKVMRREDEEKERNTKPSMKRSGKKNAYAKDQEEENKPAIQDGIHGLLDLRA